MNTSYSDSDRQAKWDGLVRRCERIQNSRYADIAAAQVELIGYLRSQVELAHLEPDMSLLTVTMSSRNTKVHLVPEGTKTYGIGIEKWFEPDTLLTTLKRMVDHLRQIDYAVPIGDPRYQDSVRHHKRKAPLTWPEVVERFQDRVSMNYPSADLDQAMVDLMPKVEQAAILLELRPAMYQGLLFDLHLPRIAALVSIMKTTPSHFEASKWVLVSFEQVGTAILDFVNHDVIKTQ